MVTVSTGGKYRWDANPIRLQPGANTITVTATDTAARTHSQTILIVYRNPSAGDPEDGAPPPRPFNLDITSPGADTIVTRNPINASGTVSGATGRPAVRWSSDRGFTGTAVVTATPDGKYRWDANPIALLLGANTIMVTATDAANRTIIRTFRVSYNFPPPDTPGTDSQPPRIAIVSPNTSFLMTSMYSLSVRGTASDLSSVSEVRWECSCGSRGIAQGTTQWTIPNISLPVGTHIIKVIAKDPFGNEGTAGFTVFRY